MSLIGSLLWTVGCAVSDTPEPGSTGTDITHTGDTVEVVADPPGPAKVTIEPAAPTSADEMRCIIVADAVDPDGDAVTYTFTWTVDSDAGLEHEGDTLAAGETLVGETWTCTVTPSDATGDGEPASTTAVVGAIDVALVDPYIQPDLWVEPSPPVPGEAVTVYYTGDLADAGQPVLVYGFDGWSQLADDSGGNTTTTTEGDRIYVHRADLVADGDGVAASFDVPEDAGALHMTVEADGVVDDRSGLEYHWGIDFPYIGPYLTYNDEAEPCNGVVVTWETSVPSLGVVEYGVDELDHYAVGQVVDTLHHAVLADLEPDTVYRYRVHDSTGRVSEEHTFATAALEADDFTFLVMADMQDGGLSTDRWDDVAEEAVALWPDAAFALLPGDLAANDHPGMWWLFFDRARPLFASTPILPVLGNHDTPNKESDPDTTSFLRQFNLPLEAGTGEYYAVAYGKTLVLALNTEVVADVEPGSAQAMWVSERLMQAVDGGEMSYDWVFAAMHHPPYDVGARFSPEQHTYRGITEAFDGLVDWAFTAHEHIYQRFGPLQYDAIDAPSSSYGVGPEDGVGYLVLPSAGDEGVFRALIGPSDPEADLRESVEYPDLTGGSVQADIQHGFVAVTVQGSTLAMTTYGMGLHDDPQPATTRDEIVYTK